MPSIGSDLVSTRRKFLPPFYYSRTNNKSIKAEDYKRIDFKWHVDECAKQGVVRERMPFGKMQCRTPQWTDPQGFPLEPMPPIPFDATGTVAGHGISLGDCLLQQEYAYATLIEPDALPLAYSGLNEIILQIHWPTLTKIPTEILVPVTHSECGPVTRFMLAHIVAVHFGRFFNDVLSDNTRSYSFWSLCGEIEGVGICLNDVYLSALINLFDDVWRADLHIQRPKRRIPKDTHPNDDLKDF
ncbi:hypothetical protein K488DRAFT_87511 [Vararia minispora EC-137]|uniref:Uncharacterized protein n=1 Tax=Vararia minispora EC-137 TaxID=1314806 RepID=A0ACB8QGH5_9AGAM|nr:hypothetical protein K488DRAFT_87511 [Vararia minispora EC-137]